MFQVVRVLSIVLAAVGVALSLSHALEFPGKLRLPRETYFAVQSIYYPGFTIGAVFGEFGAMLATFVLLVFTPFASTPFWLTLGAFISLLIMHGLYWILTHPVNKFWLEGQRMRGVGAAFFAVGGRNEGSRLEDQDWTALRSRWEYSHVARAVFAILALIGLATAAVL